YAPDGEGRVNAVSAGSGQNPITGTTYNVASEATQLNLGSGDSDAFTFDPNTFRMTQYKFTVNAQSVVGTLGWNANGSLGSLNITDAFNAANTQNCAYTHDDLARIASGNCGSLWSQTFAYDAFGNITKAGNSQFQPAYNWQTNQMTGTGYSYDANGDVLSDGLHSYAWDVATRPTTIDTVTVTYDALERVVEENKSGSYTEIVYAPMGNRLALMTGISTLQKAFAPLPAGATAVYNASGLQYYRHSDWLGSSRFSSTPTRTMYNDLAYAPFGEQYAQAGSTGVTDTSFAGNNNEDTTTNLYDAQFREYGIQGRWPSPDPAGTAAVNPSNPQSWNRYAYVLNSPTNLIDPTGFGPMICRKANKPPCLMTGGGAPPGESLNDLFEQLVLASPLDESLPDFYSPDLAWDNEGHLGLSDDPGVLLNLMGFPNGTEDSAPQAPPRSDLPAQQLQSYSVCVKSHTGYSPFQVYRMIATGTPP